MKLKIVKHFWYIATIILSINCSPTELTPLIRRMDSGVDSEGSPLRGELVWVTLVSPVIELDHSPSPKISGITPLDDDYFLITGTINGTVAFQYSDTISEEISCDGNVCMFLAKLNKDGKIVWSKTTSEGACYGNDIAAMNDTIIVTGYFNGSTTFGLAETNEISLSSNNDDIFIAKYSSKDGALLWAKSEGGDMDERANALDIYNDTFVVTGKYGSWGTGGRENISWESSGNEELLLPEYSEGGSDVFIAKYDSSGSPIWIKGFGGIEDDIGYDIALLEDGTMITTGYFSDEAVLGRGEEFESTLRARGGKRDHDIIIAKHDMNGKFLWAKSIGGSDIDIGTSVDSSQNGDFVMTGILRNQGVILSNEEMVTSLVCPMQSKYVCQFIAKFDKNGGFLWAKSAGGGSVSGNDLVVSMDGTTIVAGEFSRSVVFGQGEIKEREITSGLITSFFLTSHNQYGDLNWVRRITSEHQSENGPITLHQDNKNVTVLVTGTISGSSRIESMDTKEVEIGKDGMVSSFIAKYN